MIGKNVHLGENKNQLQHVTLELATDLNSYIMKIVISLLWGSATLDLDNMRLITTLLQPLDNKHMMFM